MSATVDDILNLSRKQGYTCMYSREELEAFPQERLDVIFAGIAALKKSEDEKDKEAK